MSKRYCELLWEYMPKGIEYTFVYKYNAILGIPQDAITFCNDGNIIL